MKVCALLGVVASAARRLGPRASGAGTPARGSEPLLRHRLIPPRIKRSRGARSCAKSSP